MPHSTQVSEDLYKNEKISLAVWLITFIVMLPTAMVVIGISSANVSLNNIAGSLAVSTDDVTWILTSYIIAEVIVLPLTSWLNSIFGRKKLILICTTIFTLGSLLCGLSTSLPMLVIARVIQGAGGGAMMPIAQAVLLENFPPSKRALAMSIFGIGILAAPIIGPSLGGWVTDNYSWTWIFYINVPIGIISIILSSVFIRDTEDNSDKKINKIDYIGLLSLIVWLVTMQIVLDQGQKADWFQSSWVCWLTFLSAIAFIVLVVWELYYKEAIMNLRVFKNLNFSIGCIIAAIFTSIIFSTIALFPLFLEALLRYPVALSGEVLMLRGVSCIFITILIGLIANKINRKFVISIGFIIWAISFLMFGDLNLEVSQDSFVWPNLICGIGQGLIFTPLTAMTFETLEISQMQNATGLYNLIRNIGASLGISSMKTMLANNAQVHQAYLVSHLAPTSLVYQQKLAQLVKQYSYHMDLYTATHKAAGQIYNLLIQQSTLLSYIDLFRFYALLSIIAIPAVLLYRSKNKSK